MNTRPDHALDEHLRRTLAAVAATVQEDAVAEPTPAPARSRRRRRLLIGAGATIAAIPLAAAAIVRYGPEYVDEIPPPNPIISGSIDGERYWVVDGRGDPDCEGSPSGVELIVEKDNVVGQEWSTVGAVFGPPTGGDGCAPRQITVPPDYTYDADGGLLVNDGMLLLGALHPDIDQVRVTLDDDEPFDAEIFNHEGRTYYVVEAPGTTDYTVEYLIDGEVVEPPTE